MLGAEQFAGTANFQILGGQRKANPQLPRRLYGQQPLGRICRHGARVRRQQIGVGLPVGASHPPAQLMQLGEAELVGALDDDGVGVGDVDAVFDDGGADQHIDPAVVEVAHHPFDLPLAHLAVADTDSGLGDQRLHRVGGLVDGAHLVVDVEDLAAAHQLPVQRFANDVVALLMHEGVDGQPLGRWRGDDRQVAQAPQG